MYVGVVKVCILQSALVAKVMGIWQDVREAMQYCFHFMPCKCFVLAMFEYTAVPGHCSTLLTDHWF